MNELIFQQYLKKNFPFTHGHGIGDDTSVVCSGNTHQLITTDLLIENIHFRLKDIGMRELALKSLAVNLSDIAAMGGIPQYFYLGLGYPSNLDWKEMKKFFQGLKNGCKKWNLELAGGDFSQSSQLFISITMVGKADYPVYRHTAKTGDLIGITGQTGVSALGLKLLLKNIHMKPWTTRHQRVTPQLLEGQILAKYVSSMIDVSDGLIIDLKRILIASGKSGHLYYEKLHIPQSMKKACQEFHFDLQELVLSGGEDYVLIFTISPENDVNLRKENIRYRIIGEVISKKNQLTVTHQGKSIQIKNNGFDHFKSKT
jgi:thiamine-monophosphate kinase